MTLKKPYPRGAFWVAGVLLTMGTLPFTLRLVWEMTLLTWREGPQMLGFAMAHSAPQFLIIGMLCWFGEAIWCATMIWMGVARKIPMATKYWAAVAAVFALVVCPMIPYGAWQGLTTAVLGLSPKSNVILVGFASEGNLEGVRRLLDKGVDANVTDSEGCSALVVAASANRVEIVSLLLERGARVDRPSCGGNTALHRAAMAGSEATVKLLLAAHADASIRNGEGFKASDLAWGAHHGAVADLIDNASAK